MTALSGLAFLFLDRQFQVAVIENVEESHLRTASWLLPAYLLAINLFVLPIAVAGLVRGLGDGDLFVLLLPLFAGNEWMALVAYLGGLSAASAMIIVATVALSSMISNDLVMPVLLRLPLLKVSQRRDLPRLILIIRRVAIVLLLLLGYVFFRLVGGSFPLVSIGMISFCGVAQFAPPIVAGIYWKEANLAGALLGLCGGVAIWLYTLVLPTLAQVGLLDGGFVVDGPLGMAFLRPQALFGVEGLGSVSHALVWSLGLNIALVVLSGLLGRQTALERIQAVLFVDVDEQQQPSDLWRGEAKVAALRGLLIRFLGQRRADTVFALDLRRRGRVLAPDAPADATLVQLAERQLARRDRLGLGPGDGGLGRGRRGDRPGRSHADPGRDFPAIEYSRQLEQKSQALERATAELREANERLRQVDQLKDDFLATVSHELRTPLTSIRSFSEILLTRPTSGRRTARSFLQIIVRESERLTRLINDFLDLAKIESGKMEWHVEDCRLAEDHRGGGRRHQQTVRRAPGGADLSLAAQRAARALRPRPHGPGRDQPLGQRRQVRARQGRAGCWSKCAHVRRRPRWCGSRTMARACRSPIARRSSRSSARSAAAQPAQGQAQGHWPRPRHLPPDRRAFRRPDLGRGREPRRRRGLLYPARGKRNREGGRIRAVKRPFAVSLS